MTIPAAEEQLKFIANIQRILDEGSFVATYKFALLMALADYAVEKGDDSGDQVQLTTHDSAESFVDYYWRQADNIAGFPVHSEGRAIRRMFQLPRQIA